MEFDILNEIMTCTVAQLFTDFSKHQNFMKTSSQMGQDKSEIPKQIDFFSLSNGGSMGSSDSLIGSKGDTAGSTTSDNPIQQWIVSDAKIRLQEAFAKLNLDNSKVSGKHLLTFTLEEL